MKGVDPSQGIVRKVLTIAATVTILVSGLSGIALAVPYSVRTDISSISGSAFQLEFDLYDNNGTIGDSWVLIDNVFIGDASGVISPPGMIDFETGGLEGFDNSLNPSSVTVVSTGTSDFSYPGISGSYLLRIDEDPWVTPTITFRNFPASTATVLGFDFELFTSGVPGFFGFDTFVVSLLDPATLNPLVLGLTGSGDILEADATGVATASGTSASPIPEPGTVLLLAGGLGGLVFKKLHRKRNKL